MVSRGFRGLQGVSGFLGVGVLQLRGGCRGLLEFKV